jgi:hyaluronoglucosaminidase
VGIGTLSGDHTELPARGQTVDAIRLAWANGSPAPSITEIIPAYDDTPPAAIVTTPGSLNLDAGNGAAVTAKITATRVEDVPVTVDAAPPTGITVSPARTPFTLRRGAQASIPLRVETAAGLATGRYQVPVTVRGKGRTVSATVTVTVWPRTTSTNVALASNGGVATASQVEDGLPQFAAGKAIDGDASTRWSSPWTDDQWLQAELAQPQRVGRVVLRWEAAHASAYEIRTSPDGVTWTIAATVRDSKGGVETVRLDAPNARFVRMQGLGRATSFGYSLYEFEVYPVAP